MTHEYAKNTVLRWLRNGERDRFRGGTVRDCNRAYAEWPVCESPKYNYLLGAGWALWDENPDGFNFLYEEGEYRIPWDATGHAPDKIPSYDQCVAHEILPLAIFDVVGLRKGEVADVFEVVHKHAITSDKAKFLRRIYNESPFNLHVLSARAILQRDFRSMYISYYENGDWPIA